MKSSTFFLMAFTTVCSFSLNTLSAKKNSNEQKSELNSKSPESLFSVMGTGARETLITPVGGLVQLVMVELELLRRAWDLAADQVIIPVKVIGKYTWDVTKYYSTGEGRKFVESLSPEQKAAFASGSLLISGGLIYLAMQTRLPLKYKALLLSTLAPSLIPLASLLPPPEK